MKRIVYFVIVCIGSLFSVLITDAQEVSLSDNTATLLKKPLKDKEAVVWYLYHSSFAVRTKTHLLIFDYFDVGDIPPVLSLANGFINPEEFKDLDVVVFVSHRDGDHYDKNIWEWKKVVKNITYVLGFEPAIAQEVYFHPQPWESIYFGNTKVTAVPATDSGEAFLVEADGLVIYHGGDNSYWWKNWWEPYKKGIDFLAGKTNYVDLLFNNWRCNGYDKRTLDEGMWYVADKFSAQAIFPMHMGTALDQIKVLIKEAPSAEKASKIVSLTRRGDVFIYRNGKIISR
jgi:L-ascorbate metabolism protein UlaG (beta-lactamase superfamily)